MTNLQFIQKIAPLVQKYAPQYGIKVCSPIIAQACLQSGFNSSKLAYKYYNFFGMKCGTAWTGASVNMATQEEYTPGVMTNIRDNFRVYSSWQQGVKGYFEFIQLKRYQNLRGITDPQKYLETISADGYATASYYVTANMRIIKQYGLTKYDMAGVPTTPQMAIKPTISKVEAAIQWMEMTAADDSHGYDQVYRWGEKGDYDCSSAVITAYEKAGVPLKSNGATYTGNLKQVALKLGFKDVTSQVNLATGEGLQRGDILLNEVHHVAMYCGNGKQVEASINEKGGARNGQPGDQTGREFLIRPYRNYPWNCALRYTAGGTVESPVKQTPITNASKVTKYIGIITASSLNVRRGPDTTYNQCSFSPLLKNTEIEVCDQQPNGWLFIKYQNKYGFVSGKYVEKKNQKVNKDFLVQVLIDDLNIRTSPNQNNNSNLTGLQTGIGTFTIVKTKGDWGLLKSYAAKENGWIYLGNPKYTKKC